MRPLAIIIHKLFSYFPKNRFSQLDILLNLCCFLLDFLNGAFLLILYIFLFELIKLLFHMLIYNILYCILWLIALTDIIECSLIIFWFFIYSLDLNDLTHQLIHVLFPDLFYKMLITSYSIHKSNESGFCHHSAWSKVFHLSKESITIHMFFQKLSQ